jgi:hypothetical protein
MKTTQILSKIKKDSKNFKLNGGNSYIQTYKTFVDYFKSIKQIKRENLIIGSHFVYGWMPTILRLNLSNEKTVLSILNQAKIGEELDLVKLEILKNSLNNSMVGTSKILHFINPKNYPIWDRRICKYIYNSKSQYKIQNPKTYLEYLDLINEIIKTEDFKLIYNKYNKISGYKITPIRLAELIMFENGK